MAGREQPYDPYIPSGGSGQGGSAGYEGGNTRTAAIQSVRSYILLQWDRVCSATDWRPWSGCLQLTPLQALTTGKFAVHGCFARDSIRPNFNTAQGRTICRFSMAFFSYHALALHSSRSCRLLRSCPLHSNPNLLFSFSKNNIR